MAKFGRMYRKAVKKAGVRKIGRKVYKATGLVNPVKRGKVSSSRLMKDVAMLKSMLNAEKKQISLGATTGTVSQCFGASGQGYLLADVTPIVSQGVTGTTRNGNSIKIHSMVLKGQLIQQSAAVQAQRIKIEFFMNKGTPLSTSNLISSVYDVNALNALYDINSTRALDTYKNWYCVSRRFYTINQDNQSNVTGFKDITIPMKFKSYHVKYQDDNTNTVTNGQLIMIITADSGNASSAAASTNSFIPVTAINTGSVINYYLNYWYYDN